MTYTVLQGDCTELLKALKPDSFDSIVTDPPYALSFMGKDWDSFGKGGFQAWCQRWARECLRVLKPGGMLLAFGGTRTYHREACAIEDAGFEIRDSLHWIYGSGFPKSLNVSKAIDKAAGAEREVINTRIKKACDFTGGNFNRDGTYPDRELQVTAPATDAAKEWEGWGTALKPAHEPIVMARKPLSAKTVAANVLEYGTGGINVDDCRVATTDNLGGGATNGSTSSQDGWDRPWKHSDSERARVGKENTKKVVKAEEMGRWPPNVLFTHSPDCMPTGNSRKEGAVTPGYGTETVAVWDCADDCPVMELDRQSGYSISRVQPKTERKGGKATNLAMGTSGATHDDQGGASRFFPCFKYQAKAPKKERPSVEGVPAHPTVKPVALMRWLVRLVTPPGGYVLDPFAGTGTTAEACELEGFDCLLIERDPGYLKLIAERMRKYESVLTP